MGRHQIKATLAAVGGSMPEIADRGPRLAAPRDWLTLSELAGPMQLERRLEVVSRRQTRGRRDVAAVWCQPPATTQAEIIPTLKRYPKGREEIKRLAVKAPVCAHHAMAINRDRDWQQRQQQAREAQRQALKAATEAAQLFDPAALDERRAHRRPARTRPTSTKGKATR